MKTQITLGQVKQIALEVSQKFEVVNKGTYYNVIDKKTRKCSIEGGDSNLVSGSFIHLSNTPTLNLLMRTACILIGKLMV